MLVRFLILIVSFLIPSITQASAGAKPVISSNVDAVEKAILDAWKPDGENCGPMVRMVDGFPIRMREHSIVHDYAEGALACMIRGYRDIAWTYYNEVRPGFEAVARKHGIAIMTMEGEKNLGGDTRTEYVMFKPEKEAEALLFRIFKNLDLLNEQDKANVRQSRHYLLAHLLDSPDEDIKAYYLIQKEEKPQAFGHDFESDKKIALALIEKYTKEMKLHKSMSSAAKTSAGSAGSAAAPACSVFDRPSGAGMVESAVWNPFAPSVAFDLKKIEEALLQKYKPTTSLCGPNYRAKKDGSFEYVRTITDNVEGALACMLKEYRDRTFAGGQLSPELRALAVSKNITILTLHGNQTILFATKARKEGLLVGKLLLSSSKEKHSSEDFNYLLGHLLGYSDADALISSQHKNKSEIKQYAQAWIKKNEIDLEQWAAKNLSLYPSSQVAQKQAVSGAAKSIKDFNAFLFSIYITLSEKDRMEIGSALLAIYDQLSPADQKEAVAMMHNVGLDFEKERQKILSSSIKAKTETQKSSADSQTAAAGSAVASKKK